MISPFCEKESLFNASYELQNIISLIENENQNDIFSTSINFSENTNLLPGDELSSTNNKSNNLPEFYSLSRINSIIEDSKFNDRIILDKRFEETKDYYFFQHLKKQRINYDSFEYNFLNELNIKSENDEKNKKREREKKSDKPEHTKFKPDNIIKKIKAIFFKKAVDFINNILNLKGKNQLLNLDYYLYINNLNRNIDIGYLNMSLKDLLSLKVSKKYITDKDNKEENYEEIYHNKIILDNINNENDKTVKFVLNMSFNDFIELFINKISVNKLIKEKGFNSYDIDTNKIKKSIKGFEQTLTKIKKKNKNDIYYMTNFLFYLYNYARWFLIKTPRNHKAKIK